jgi:hypothetical protein
MSKKKMNLPPSIGAELKRSNPSPRRFDPTDDSGRDAALAFNEKHEALFKALAQAVGIMIAQRDGDSMLLMDGALLGACAHLRDAMQRQGVTVVPDVTRQ